MPYVFTVTHSDGTVEPTSIRVPWEQAQKLAEEMSWVAEAWSSPGGRSGVRLPPPRRRPPVEDQVAPAPVVEPQAEPELAGPPPLPVVGISPVSGRPALLPAPPPLRRRSP
ncbi:MAG: hypothetical protein RJA59_419 [Pseudomonadota bacterium]